MECTGQGTTQAQNVQNDNRLVLKGRERKERVREKRYMLWEQAVVVTDRWR